MRLYRFCSSISCVLAGSFAGILLFAGVPAAAQTIGSSLVPRNNVDSAAGQFYIYAGGSFTAGSTVTSYSIYNNQTSGNVMTPLLLEQTSAGVYTVRGRGAGQTISSLATPQTFAFGLQQGTALASNGNFTIGYINALVNADGFNTVSSAGTVEFNGLQAGAGVSGGSSTNAWLFTTGGGSAAIGATISGGGGRTYSMTATAIAGASGAPEPGSLALLGVGVMPLAVMIAGRRRRYRKG